jgi:hypothetical protein
MSRIIEQQMIRAISNETDWKKDNTSVVVIPGTPWPPNFCTTFSKEIQVRLHGNLIARIFPGNLIACNLTDHIFPGNKMILSSCGWVTNTTKSRLNSILHHYNLGGIFQKDYVWYCDKGEFEDNMEFAIS